jgi:hypothetical protein
MKQMLDAGLVKPLHNKQLETEYYAGCILHGYRYDQEYLDLIINLADLPLIILNNNIEWNTQIKVLYDLFYVGDNEVWKDNIIKGKEQKLKSALEILKPLASEYYQRFATEFVYSEAYKEMLTQNNYEQALGTDDLGFVIDNTNEFGYRAQEEEKIHQLKRFVVIADAILYDIDRVNFNNTYTKVSFKKDLVNLRMYVNDLEIYIEQEGTNIPVSMVLSNVLRSLVVSYPTASEMLDLYKTDSYIDAFDILSYPSKLYKNLISDKIVNPILSNAISACYPESYEIMIDKLIKSLDSFDLDKQNRLKMYSGAFETDTLLVQQVNNALMKGYAQNVT